MSAKRLADRVHYNVVTMMMAAFWLLALVPVHVYNSQLGVGIWMATSATWIGSRAVLRNLRLQKEATP